MSPVTSPQMQHHNCSARALPSSFCSLSESVHTALEQIKTMTSWRAGEVVFHEDDPCHTVFMVCEGRLKLVTTSRSGRQFLLRFVEAGQILGLAEALRPGSVYDCSAIAAEPSQLGAIPRERFARFIASYPEAASQVTVALSEQYRQAQREEKFLGLADTSTVRLAHLLLEWSADVGQPFGTGVRIPIHVTHNDLAQAVGTTRETVTRILSDLNHRGIVVRSSGEVVISDPSALARLGTI